MSFSRKSNKHPKMVWKEKANIPINQSPTIKIENKSNKKLKDGELVLAVLKAKSDQLSKNLATMTRTIMRDFENEFIELAKLIPKENCNAYYYFDKLVLQNNIKEIFTYDMLYKKKMVHTNLTYPRFRDEKTKPIIANKCDMSPVTAIFAKKIDTIYLPFSKVFPHTLSEFDKVKLSVITRLRYFMYYIVTRQQRILRILPLNLINRIFVSMIFDRKDLWNIALVCKTSYEAVKQIKVSPKCEFKCNFCEFITTKRSIETKGCIHECDYYMELPFYPLIRGEYCKDCDVAIFQKSLSSGCYSCEQKTKLFRGLLSEEMRIPLFLDAIEPLIKTMRFSPNDVLNLALACKNVHSIAKNIIFPLPKGKIIKCIKCNENTIISESALGFHSNVCGKCFYANSCKYCVIPLFTKGDTLCWVKCPCANWFFIKQPCLDDIPKCILCR